ncbi:magnesium transporter [Candidatus Bathyarchaeota archaeon]|nr:magnesium transporter [Candidatus Bathyarchaeota archaeon]
MVFGATTAIPGRLSRFFNTVPGQTLIALSFNLISLFAGGLMAVFTPQFTANPWILALFPPVLTVRGGIGGIFSGNLATMLHLGLVKPRLRDNTPSFYGLVKSVLVITALDTVVLGLVSFAFNLVSGNATPDMWVIFLVVPTVACLLAVGFSLPLTSYIAIETYRRGLDPDILVYPILASVNDIVVTTFYVATVSLVLVGGPLFLGVKALFVLIVAVIGYLAKQSRLDMFFRQTLREGTFVVVISSLFGSVNGVALSRLGGSLKQIPGLMAMYPALTNALGNIGSIIGSQTTTRMALGYARSFAEELRDAGVSLVQVEVPAAFMHVVFAVTAWLITGPSTPGVNLLTLLVIALVSNLASFGVISVFALFSAHQAFERGLNPDNIVIPAITSVSDTIATLAVTPAIMAARLLGL